VAYLDALDVGYRVEASGPAHPLIPSILESHEVRLRIYKYL